MLNRLSAAMTRSAFYGTDHRGRPAQPAWWAARPVKRTVPMEPLEARNWFPRAFLGFPQDRLEEVLRAATQRRPENAALLCRTCGVYVGLAAFVHNPARLRVRPTLPGRWVGLCPSCRREGQWCSLDAVPATTQHKLPIPFKQRFTSALADGLPLLTTGPCVYCGPLAFSSARDLPNLPDAQVRQLKLVPHRFHSELTDSGSLVYLPPDARIVAEQGQSLLGGEPWAYALAGMPLTCRTSGFSTRSFSMPNWAACSCCRQNWFSGRHMRSGPRNCSGTCCRRRNTTTGRWAAILPPLRLRHWDQLRFRMPGDVHLQCAITDPRFSSCPYDANAQCAPNRFSTKASGATETISARRAG